MVKEKGSSGDEDGEGLMLRVLWEELIKKEKGREKEKEKRREGKR